VSRVRLAAVALVILAIGCQFIRPARTNPAVDASQGIGAHVTIPPDTRAILQRACGDCHSNETRWPWYSNVAPTSWFVINHVNDGRRALNLDDWNAHNRRVTSPPFDRICRDVRDGEMPIWNYLLIHHDARLSAADIDNLCTWANGVSAR
jgi:hypothetical protein